MSNEEHRLPKIVEDVPMMMSVPMRTSMAPAMSVSSFPVNQKPTPSRLVGAESKEDSKISRTVTGSPWKVSKALAIPYCYKLERTHIVVPNASSLVVSERITDCLYRQSIFATYDDNEVCIFLLLHVDIRMECGRTGKSGILGISARVAAYEFFLYSCVVQILAKAETRDCFTFSVRLWEVDEQVVVEIQRSSGCSFSYHQTAKAILRAAKFGSSPMKAPPLSIPRCVPQLPGVEWDSCTAEGLEIVGKSLKQGSRLDAQLLAMESLVQLTEASKCRAFCAKSILSSDSELLSSILSLIKTSRMKEAEDNEFSTEITEEHLKKMHHHALTILANCLQCGQQSCELSVAVQGLPELTCDAILNALVRDLAAASSKPHDATDACRCLQALCGACADTKERVLQLGAAGFVSDAKHFRHALLEKECAILMRELEE